MSRINRSTHAVNEQIKRTTKRNASIKHYMFGSFKGAPRTMLLSSSLETFARIAVVAIVACIVFGAL